MRGQAHPNMNPYEDSIAIGGPGIEARWTSSAKEGAGTAYHTSCRLWFTLSDGIINELYYPHVDQPNTCNSQFLITDGESFCHEKKRGLTHQIESENNLSQPAIQSWDNTRHVVD